MDTGERIKFFAKKRHGNVRQFAIACGINPGQMGKYVSGLSHPTLPVLARFQENGGMSIDWLISGTGSMDAASTPFVVDSASPVGAYLGEQGLTEIFHPDDPDIAAHIEWVETTMRVFKEMLLAQSNARATSPKKQGKKKERKK